MYRQALLMAGDPMYRRARMEGDPFLGGLVRIGAGLVGKLARTGVGRAIGKAVGIGRRIAQRHPVATSIGAGAAIDIASRKFLSSKGGGGGGGGRRMNVTNPRALRRAIRRVTGFGKTVKRMKRGIALAASAVGVKRSARKAPRRR